ncbi:MAG: mobile mystery protein B [Burkholderiales bacterium]|nr:mobile mystery protein B [Burkholderiales bacterium]
MKKLSINQDLPYGATELTLDDMEGLIPDYILTRKELDEFEKANIVNAVLWLRRKNLKYQNILSMEFIFELHNKMFDKTWKWAGTLRHVAVNIGNTPVEQIQVRIKNTLDNTIYWIENHVFSIDEICVRLHHELVWIHPFPNGNGRFSRIISDELRQSLGSEPFAWGSTENNLTISSENRAKYIHALRLADKKDYVKLVDFAIGEKD